ncbi:hypothetical protein CLV31_102214 [Algoriphagus aquaeductus]|uniref:Uncharacterized protein n=1 Tax=Algoriphagus aquaeductus TaxID=475299 RepID=A0A326RXW0_9BACT|nr:hypothetical protein CLV31_102214 [Algoriphagus aquaeductus]
MGVNSLLKTLLGMVDNYGVIPDNFLFGNELAWFSG